MFDLPYIATHPLLAAIVQRCAVLSEQAEELAPDSDARKKLDRRISELEQYKLPKPDARDLAPSEPIVDSSGQKIGEWHSVRRRFIAKWRGRPEEFRIKVRAAREEKLAHPRTTWREFCEKSWRSKESLCPAACECGRLPRNLQLLAKRSLLRRPSRGRWSFEIQEWRQSPKSWVAWAREPLRQRRSKLVFFKRGFPCPSVASAVVLRS